MPDTSVTILCIYVTHKGKIFINKTMGECFLHLNIENISSSKAGSVQIAVLKGL